VTLNGRTLATENKGREFSFDVLPSELIGGADVFKKPHCPSERRSIGATIDIRTLRPLELAPFVAAVTAQAKREELDNSWVRHFPVFRAGTTSMTLWAYRLSAPTTIAKSEPTSSTSARGGSTQQR